MPTRPVVVVVAITGSVPRKKDNPNLPVLPSEQIASARAAFEAGASLVHIHVRHDDETPSSDPDRFAQVQAGIREVCPGMIIQFSTGGRERDPAARTSPRHGLAFDRLSELSDDRVRESDEPGERFRCADAGASDRTGIITDANTFAAVRSRLSPEQVAETGPTWLPRRDPWGMPITVVTR